VAVVADGLILETRALTRRFGGLVAVNDVSLALRDGELRALIGPNGAGKTTLINLLSGLMPASGGEIWFRGRPADVPARRAWLRGELITAWPAARRARAGIARTMQVTAICPTLTVLENVWLSAQRGLGRPPALVSRQRLPGVADHSHRCLQLVGIDARADELAGAIGHGDQRLLEIAIALALRPRLLLLDEPTAGMSVKESWEIVERLREIRQRERLTVLIVEHDMEIVMQLAERITVLHLGQTLAEGTPDEVARNADVQRVYLGGR
jgi:branched-chain amino acid transport system ATP-binding protein